MTTFARLDRAMTRRARNLERSVENLGQGIGTRIGQLLIPATPRKTGLARANFRPSLGAPVTRPTTLTDYGGAATIARIALVARGFRLGVAFYITNNLSYIGDLNRGSSPQAPPNFVRTAVARAVFEAVRRAEQRGFLR